METKKILSVFFSIVLLLCIAACSDDNDPAYYKVPVKLEYENGYSINYEYDDKLHLIKMEYKDVENNIVISSDMTYDMQGRVSHIKVADTSVEEYEFTYDGNKISVNQLNSYTQTIETNNKGQLVRISGYEDPGQEFRYLYDSRGNINEEASYNNGEFIRKSIYLYDSKNGYSRNINSPVWISYYNGLDMLLPGKVNNEINESEYKAKDSGIQEITKATYEYDEENYPIKAVFYDAGGEVMNQLTISYESRLMK